MCVTVLATSCLEAATSRGSVKSPRDTLVVLRDETVPNAIIPASGKKLADLANSKTESARQLNAALCFPTKVRELIFERPDGDYVDALKPGSTEHRLLNYVLLQYPDVTTAAVARESLIARRIFHSVQADTSAQFLRPRTTRTLHRCKVVH